MKVGAGTETLPYHTSKLQTSGRSLPYHDSAHPGPSIAAPLPRVKPFWAVLDPPSIHPPVSQRLSELLGLGSIPFARSHPD